jgi:hypothetical protein
MLSEGHGQANQVRRLLQEAERVCADQGFVPIDHGEAGLDVVVGGPARPLGDATNYLGGIADVLRQKSNSSLSLDHLGGLATVRLYSNDRQISQVSYREQVGGQASYTVTVRMVGDEDTQEATVVNAAHE